MGILDMFKKKKESSPSPEIEEEHEELPPLPEIKMDPELDEPVAADIPEPDVPEIMVDDAELDEEEPEELPENLPAEVPEPLAPQPAPVQAPEPDIIRTQLPPTIFVSVNDYQKIMDGVNFVKSKISKAEDDLKVLNSLQNAEEKELNSMRSMLEDVQRKITYVDEVIFQAG